MSHVQNPPSCTLPAHLPRRDPNHVRVPTYRYVAAVIIGMTDFLGSAIVEHNGERVHKTCEQTSKDNACTNILTWSKSARGRCPKCDCSELVLKKPFLIAKYR